MQLGDFTASPAVHSRLICLAQGNNFPQISGKHIENFPTITCSASWREKDRVHRKPSLHETLFTLRSINFSNKAFTLLWLISTQNPRTSNNCINNNMFSWKSHSQGTSTQETDRRVRSCESPTRATERKLKTHIGACSLCKFEVKAECIILTTAGRKCAAPAASLSTASPSKRMKGAWLHVVHVGCSRKWEHLSLTVSLTSRLQSGAKVLLWQLI